jgi:hypothetical protein
LSRGRRIAIVAGIVLAVAAIFAGYQGVSLARIAVNYAAQQTCACLFVSRRSPDSCQKDFSEVAARLVALQIEDRAVTASVLGMVSGRSEFEEGVGCHVAR